MSRAGQKGVVPFDVTGMELKKSHFKGHPVREVKQFIEVANEFNKPFHVALLECGHGVARAKSVMAAREDRKRHGMACYLCPVIEKPKPAPKAEPERPHKDTATEKLLEQVKQQNVVLGELVKQITGLNKRVEQVEEVATRPGEVSSTNAPDGGNSPQS